MLPSLSVVFLLRLLDGRVRIRCKEHESTILPSVNSSQWTFGMWPNEKCSQQTYSNCVMLSCTYGPKSEKGQSRFWPQFIYYFGQVKENCPLKSIVKTALCMCEKKKFNYFSQTKVSQE